MEFNGNRYIGDIVLKRRPEGGSYLNDIPAVKYLMEAGHIELRSPVTFFIGENGTGKSTLLEAIAVAAGFNPEGGTKLQLFHPKYPFRALRLHITDQVRLPEGRIFSPGRKLL